MQPLPRLKLLLLLAAACGGDDAVGVLPDAPSGNADSSIDAPAATGMVKVTMLEGTRPLEEYVVYFQNADHSLAALRVTDANGVATAQVAAGGYLTVADLHPDDVARNYVTIMGVKPGDQLLFQRGPRSAKPFEVSFTLPAVDADQTGTGVWTTCGVNTTDATDTPTVEATCTTADVIVDASTDSGPYKYIYRPSQALVAPISYTAATYAAMPTVTSTFTGVTIPNIESRRIERVLSTTNGRLYTCASTTELTTLSATMACPSIPNSSTTDIAYVRDATTQWTTYSPTTNTTTTVDLAPGFLKGITSEPTLDLAARSVSWGESASGTAADFVSFTVRGSTNFANADMTFSWEVVAPRTSTSFTLPVLTADDGRFNLKPGDDVSLVQFSLGSAPGGYDAVRSKLYAASSFTNAAFAATARLMLTTWYLWEL